MSKIRFNQLNSGELADFVTTLFDGQLTSIEDGITSLSGDLSVLEARVDTISGVLDIFSGDVEAMSGLTEITAMRLEDLSGSVDDIIADVSTLSGRIAQLSGNLDSVSGQSQTAYDISQYVYSGLLTVSGNLNDQIIDLSIVQADLSTLTSQFNSLSGNYISFKNDVGNWSGDVTTATGILMSQLQAISGWVSGDPGGTGVSGYMDSISGNVRYLPYSGGSIGIKHATGNTPSGLLNPYELSFFVSGTGNILYAKFMGSGGLWRVHAIGSGSAANV